MTLGLAIALSLYASAADVSVAQKGHAFNPHWSPDGQWIAFELNEYEGRVDLYVVKMLNGNPVGSPQKVVLPGASSAFAAGGSVAAAPTWHPKGQLIFEGSNPGGSNRLYFWAPGGQSAAELLNAGQISGDLTWPTVSPDGKTVAFVSDATGSGDIYLWDRSSNAVQLAMTSPFSEAAPRFNADNARLAYSRKNQGGEDLFVMDGGKGTPQVGGNGDQTRPVYVGESVVFFTNERGDDRWDVAVSAGAGQKSILARDIRLPLRAAPAVTPDGKWVAYGLAIPESANQIAFTSIDGARTVKVDTGLVACGEPSVVQVGEKIYLAFTALPSMGADWRQLHIMDITEKLK